MVKRSEAAGYVFIVVLVFFGGRGATWSYNFVCPPGLRQGCILSVVEAEVKREVGENRDEVKLREDK